MAPSFSPDALYLALETSGSLGSAAVALGAHVLARAFLDRPLHYVADLIPRTAAMLSEAGVDRSELAGVVVGRGPGSFTGVRVAAATAKGIAHALEVPLWAFSSLEAAAVAEWVLPNASPSQGLRYVLFDARADRVYGACYEVGPDTVTEKVPPHATRIEALLGERLPADVTFVGDGAVRHEAVLQARGYRVLPPPAGIPTADGLLHLLALRPDTAPAVRVGPWEPEYVKGSSAQPARAG